MDEGRLARGPMVAITLMRVVVGWHFLYEGLAKLTAPSWSASGFLKQARGPFADFFKGLAANQNLLANADLITMWGLTLVGLCLVLGLFTRLASLGGIGFLLLFYLSTPPFVGYFYSLPQEGSYLVVNKNLVELSALVVILVTGSGRFAGLDRLVHAFLRPFTTGRHDMRRTESVPGDHTMSNDTQPSSLVSRRRFVGTVATAAGVTIVPRHVLGGTGYQAPSDTVNVAVVGYIHGMGTSNLRSVAKTDNIVALCDCDESEAATAALKRTKVLEAHSKAARYKDYRVMLEKQKDVDALVVATPDHTHAVIAMAAMQLGKHVYVQKPLTRTVSEARALTEAARRYKVVTQMGNQGHSEEGLRLMEEWVAAGAIGKVHEVHCWTNRPIWPQGMPRPTEAPAVPDGFDWDLWVGPSPMRPYHPTYHPFGWRAWWDFGAGAMGDMGCHVLDASFQVLKLSAPTSVIASIGYNVLRVPNDEGVLQNRRVQYNDSYPPSSVIHMVFPARGDLPPVKLHWYDGGILPERPDDLEPERRMPESGTIFVGDKGKMWCETYSESPRLIPETAMNAFTPRPPKTLPRVEGGRSGHEKNWLDAIRRHGQAVSHFDYAGPFTESVLLGNVALRFPGTRLFWDAPTMRLTNMPEADEFIQHQYRPGWSL